MRRVVHQRSVCVDSYQILPFFWLNCSACADYGCSGAYILESQKNSDVLRATHVYSPMDGIGNGYHQLSCYKSGPTRRLSLARVPLNSSPSSSVRKISPMPNSPITATRKSKPASRCV